MSTQSGLPLVMGFRWSWALCVARVHCGLAGGLSPSAFISVCYFCIYLSTAGQWTLMSGGGVHCWVWGCLFSWLVLCVFWLVFGVHWVCFGL